MTRDAVSAAGCCFAGACSIDNCPFVPNRNQVDSDRDSRGNACDRTGTAVSDITFFSHTVRFLHCCSEKQTEVAILMMTRCFTTTVTQCGEKVLFLLGCWALDTKRCFRLGSNELCTVTVLRATCNRMPPSVCDWLSEE
jgi:hypothetical protein